MLTDRIHLHAELGDLIDRIVLFHQARNPSVAGAYVRCAEVLLREIYAPAAAAISLAASRKGAGNALAGRIIPHLDDAGAAAAVMILLFRGARKPVVKAINSAFAGRLAFHEAQRRLLEKILI